jgi:hypothetical protein
VPEFLSRWNRSERRQLIWLGIWLAVLAAVFAQVEIQIEGADGWAARLPTWRIEHHWLLEVFWGGRPLTGYHAWVFLFMFLVFHFALVIQGRPSLRLELRVLGLLAVFWIVEDFLWFMMNPAYGLSRFKPEHIPWHHHWLLGMPADYGIYLLAGAALIGLSFRRRRRTVMAGETR